MGKARSVSNDSFQQWLARRFSYSWESWSKELRTSPLELASGAAAIAQDDLRALVAISQGERPDAGALEMLPNSEIGDAFDAFQLSGLPGNVLLFVVLETAIGSQWLVRSAIHYSTGNIDGAQREFALYESSMKSVLLVLDELEPGFLSR